MLAIRKEDLPAKYSRLKEELHVYTARRFLPSHNFPFFSWTNERLDPGSEPAEICARVKKCNIHETFEEKITKVPKQKCDLIPYDRLVCRVETVQDPPTTVSVVEAFL